MALAAHNLKVRIRTSSGLGTDSDNMSGVHDVSLSRMRDELETTDFNDTSKNFILGLKGAEVTFSGTYESADTAYGRIETAFGDGTSVYAVILWNGTAGHNVECKVVTLETSGARDGLVEVSGTLRATGAVSTV